MKIKILTTEKKLTTSHVNQMQVASMDDMREGKLLGYLINVRKGERKVLLIQNDDRYVLLTCGWYEVCGDPEGLFRLARKGYYTTFKTDEYRKEFMRLYEAALREAKQIYV